MSNQLTDIAAKIRPLVIEATGALGSDLQGFSVIDLVLDNCNGLVSTSDAKAALVIAGVDRYLSPRLVRSYSCQNEY